MTATLLTACGGDEADSPATPTSPTTPPVHASVAGRWTDAETFMVRIRPSVNVSCNATLDARDRTTVTINDNDDPPGVEAADKMAGEGAGNLDVVVSLSTASAKPVTVDYAVAAGTATAGADYTAVADGTLTFAPGTTAQTVSVPVLDDELHEPDETLTLTLSGRPTRRLRVRLRRGRSTTTSWRRW